MRKDWDTLPLGDRSFDAIEPKDYDTLESCCAPEAVIWHSHDCLYPSRAASLAMLKEGMQRHQKMRFRDRRVHAFARGFVQQHSSMRGTHDALGRGELREGRHRLHPVRHDGREELTFLETRRARVFQLVSQSRSGP
jgi:hypothetical protein